MIIAINENYVNIEDISVITEVKYFYTHKVYYAFYVILKSGKEIEISSTDKSSLEKERMRAIEKILKIGD